MSESISDVTPILRRVNAGEAQATEELLQVVYAELKRQARIAMSRERDDHTLQPTALVHEAYIHLIGGAQVNWESSFHFFFVAARTMRRILVDHARHVKAKKRFGGQRVELNENLVLSPQKADSFLTLETALERLEAVHPRHARVVELKYFGGLGFEELASFLGVSSRTAKRDWDFARAWLHSEMSKDI